MRNENENKMIERFRLSRCYSLTLTPSERDPEHPSCLINLPRADLAWPTQLRPSPTGNVCLRPLQSQGGHSLPPIPHQRGAQFHDVTQCSTVHSEVPRHQLRFPGPAPPRSARDLVSLFYLFPSCVASCRVVSCRACLPGSLSAPVASGGDLSI